MKSKENRISPLSVKRVPYSGDTSAGISLGPIPSLPFPCIQPDGVNNLYDYLKSSTDNANLTSKLKRRLHTEGALLFRGFSDLQADELNKVVDFFCEEALEYRERSSPRSLVSGKVYTSTEYPSHQRIFFHNENAYQANWPQVLLFYCHRPSPIGGETPLADTRKVLNRIPLEIRDCFHRKKIKYVRNFSPTHGLTWQKVFQEESKEVVEAYCRKNGLYFKWKGEMHLETQSVREAILRHPVTSELVWFNHAAFFHVSTLGEVLSQNLIEYFGEENLPNQTFYGDGSPIEDEVLKILRNAYEEETVSFKWQKSDVLIVDNMLFSHSRQSFEGERAIWLAMGNSRSSESCKTDSIYD